MAIYHFAMQNISANRGKTAIASASYRSGQELYSEKEGRRYLYKRSVKPETFILVPENAPEWASDRNRLWNEVEAVETSKNSRYAKEINLALPIELSEDEQKEMLLKYCKENFSDKGMVADIAIHRDHDDNPHAHIMLTNRPFNEDGSWGVKSTKVYINDENGNPIILPSGYRKSRKEYTTNWDNKETLNSWRKNWAIAINQSLKLKGIDEEVSHLSYDEQGIDKVATRHEGYGKKGQENKEYNDEVKELNKLKDKLKTKEIELKTNHEFNLLTKEFTEKESERIKELSKSLKTYIDIENIADKKRMINNWKTSVIGKEFLGQEQVENLKIIGNQEKAIDEADKIIEHIFSDKILIDGKLSSVGIVTLNLEQKTNIVNRINSYLRENDNETVKSRYNELLEKNMFVKNLENVQGDERDVMIFSTTFGKNEEGKFIQNFGPLNNQQKGYKLLNVLITRAKYKFDVFTSIPEENINTWENEITKNGNNGRGVFYAYLAYAQAVSENDTDKENRILDTLAVNKTKYSSIPYEKVQETDSKIIKIIAKETGMSENEEVVKNYRIGGFVLPYAVKDKDTDRAKTVIDINDIETFNGKTAYRGLIYRKNMFEGMGYKYKLLNMADYI